MGLGYFWEGNRVRFTDEKKWSDKWFRSLPPIHKLVWLYICDNCDIAGFYEVDIESISFHTKVSEDDCKVAIEGLSRGYLGADFIWIRNFLKHQNNHLLNPNNNCHKGIIKRIQMNLKAFPEIPEILGATEGLFSPTSKSKGKSKGKSNSKSNCKEDKDIEEILSYLNQKLNKSFRSAKGLKSRLEEGYTIEDAKKVIDTKTAEWQNDPEMCKYLTPDTLFSQKFDKYLNQPVVEKAAVRTWEQPKEEKKAYRL